MIARGIAGATQARAARRSAMAGSRSRITWSRPIPRSVYAHATLGHSVSPAGRPNPMNTHFTHRNMPATASVKTDHMNAASIRPRRATIAAITTPRSSGIVSPHPMVALNPSS